MKIRVMQQGQPWAVPTQAVGAPGGPIATLKLTQGLTGRPGAASSGVGSGQMFYEHQQPTAAPFWTINHNLGFRPAVSVLSTGGVLMLAQVVHASLNQALVYFDQPTPGQAICS